MTITHITYCNDRMTMSAKNCQQMAIAQGWKSVIFTPNDLDKDFRERNAEILSDPRGAGFWIWKPYIVDKALREIGGMIIYTDAGVNISGGVDFEPTLFFAHTTCVHADWCKMDVIVEMDCKEHMYKQQLQATYFALQSNDFNISLVSEWLRLVQIKRYIDDSPSRIKNVETFQQHRYDQAILTNLVYKRGIVPRNKPDSLNKHGRRNPGMGEAVKENNYIKRKEW